MALNAEVLFNSTRVKFGDRARSDELATTHDCEKVTVATNEIKILLDQQNRHTLFGDEVPDHLSDHGDDALAEYLQ